MTTIGKDQEMEVRKLKNYINGQWVESKTSQWLEMRNPTKDEVIGLFIPSMIEGKHQGKFVY